jgi:hypothetical protein
MFQIEAEGLRKQALGRFPGVPRMGELRGVPRMGDESATPAAVTSTVGDVLRPRARRAEGDSE